MFNPYLPTRMQPELKIRIFMSPDFISGFTSRTLDANRLKILFDLEELVGQLADNPNITFCASREVLLILNRHKKLDQLPLFEPPVADDRVKPHVDSTYRDYGIILSIPSTVLDDELANPDTQPIIISSSLFPFLWRLLSATEENPVKKFYRHANFFQRHAECVAQMMSWTIKKEAIETEMERSVSESG